MIKLIINEDGIDHSYECANGFVSRCVSAVHGQNFADARKVALILNNHQALVHALTELHAQVLGECPSLLNEDSGGDAHLNMEIKRILGAVGSPPAPVKATSNSVTQSERDILNAAIIPPAPEADAWDKKRVPPAGHE